MCEFDARIPAFCRRLHLAAPSLRVECSQSFSVRLSRSKTALQACSVALCNNRRFVIKLSHFAIPVAFCNEKAVVLCNKLEMDVRRTSKPNNKYHHRQQQQQLQQQQQQQQQQ